MSLYAHKKPRYVREWYLELKKRMKKRKVEREAEELENNKMIEQEMELQNKTQATDGNQKTPATAKEKSFAEKMNEEYERLMGEE